MRRYGLIILLVPVISGAALYAVHLGKGISLFKPGPSHGGRVLEIKGAVSGRVYGKWPLEEAGEFAIEFIHSVNQSPVRESFAAEGGIIRPQAVRFSSFGAGMQSDLEEGMNLSRDGDAMIITGFKTSFKELNYIVGTVSDHLLYINGETVSLRDLCGKNAHIKVLLK